MIRQNYNDLCMEERPQYRAYNYGMDTLSNVELLSLVMNRGAGTKESLQQARQIYNIMDEKRWLGRLTSAVAWHSITFFSLRWRTTRKNVSSWC